MGRVIKIKEHPSSIIIVEYKDRLASFGYRYLEKLKNYSGKIKIVKKK